MISFHRNPWLLLRALPRPTKVGRPGLSRERRARSRLYGAFQLVDWKRSTEGEGGFANLWVY